jgi:hypothetical protein
MCRWTSYLYWCALYNCWITFFSCYDYPWYYLLQLGYNCIYLDNYVKSNFPTDSDGNLCGVDVHGYNYVYFANAPQIVLLFFYFRIVEYVLESVLLLLIVNLIVTWLMMLDVNIKIILVSKYLNIITLHMMEV